MWLMVFLLLLNVDFTRVEAQSKMTMMKEKAVKDVAQYNTEIKESERVIAHERRLKEFMTTKCSERASPDDGLDPGRRRGKTTRQVGEHYMQYYCSFGLLPIKVFG